MYPERYGTSYGAAEAVGLPVPQWVLWLGADAERHGEVSTPSNPSPTVGLGRSLRLARRWVEGATLRARPSAKDAPLASGLFVACLWLYCGLHCCLQPLARRADTITTTACAEGWD